MRQVHMLIYAFGGALCAGNACLAQIEIECGFAVRIEYPVACCGVFNYQIVGNSL